MAPANNTSALPSPHSPPSNTAAGSCFPGKAAHRAPAADLPEDPPVAEDPYLEEVNRLAEHLEPQEVEIEAPETKLSSRPERTRISCHAALDTAVCAPFRKKGA